tara:strand:+ start:99 stop:1733 length:1635 start_codon:yes stop_codon:yes gene_type:complete
MSYQVLARKWRPKKFQDVIGQEAITRSLQNAIKRARLGHAYLFAGTRGIGKTSVARLFAQAIRCESLTPDGNPCGQCSPCQDMHQQNSMNVIEIDGASNNTVDEVRELINNVQYLPTNGNYKIYIIDEVHMLSKSAFNALLKTLEEPPAHVIFLLATTEPHKLLGTVLSRCQRFDFVNASINDLTGHILKIAQSEGIEFSNENLVRDIARLGQGSVRDTLSLLDQVLSYTSDNHVNEKVLAQSLGVARREVLDQILSAMISARADDCLEATRMALSENISLKALTSAILESLFDLIENLDNSEWLDKKPELAQAIEHVAAAELFWIYESLSKDSTWLFNALAPEATLFVILKKLSLRHRLLGLDQKQQEPKKKVIKPEPLISPTKAEPTPAPVVEVIKEEIKPPVTKVSKIEDFLVMLEKNAPTLSASLEHAHLDQKLFAQEKCLKVTYPSDGQVFFDVVNEESSKQRLIQLLKEHVDENAKLLIDITPSQDEGLQTRAQERKAKDAVDEEARKHELMNDPMLKMAQDMFNTKVDKIQLGKKGE